MKKWVHLLLSAALAAAVLSISLGANSQALLEQGMEAFKSSNYKNAELLFRKCIEADDENTEKAWFFLARSLYSQKKYKDAIFEFNRFLLNCRSVDLCTESRFWIAESYYNTSDSIRAIEEYKRFISQNKDQGIVLVSLSHERIADLYARQMRYDEAIIEWKLAADSTSQSERKTAISLRIADAFFLSKKYDESEALLGVMALDRDPLVAAQSNILLGRINAQRGKPRVAMRFYSRVPDSMTATPPCSDVLYFKALAFIDLEDKESAKSFLQSFINVSKNSAWFLHARFRLASLSAAQNPADSIAVMTDIMKTAADSDLKIDLSIELEKLFVLQNRAGEGIAALEEVRQIGDSDRQKDLLYELGSAYLAVRNFDAAENVFTEMMNRYSFDKDADKIQFQLAVVYLRKGDSVKAADSFQKISSINPFSIYLGEANYYMASAQFDQGNYKAAISFLGEYLKNQNGDKRYDSYLLQLKSFIKLKDYPDAEKTAGNISRRYYDHVGVDLVLMDFIHFAYDFRQDSSYYENLILRLFPDSDSAAAVCLLRAQTEFDKKNWRKAELQYSAYLKIKGNETNPQAFINKGIALYKQGDFAGVITFLSNEKLEIFNSAYSSDIVLLLAKSYYLSGQNDKAYECFTAAREYISQSDDLFYYFESSLKNDNITVAKDISAKLRDDNEIYYRSLYEIGLYYKEIFNYDDARGYFSRVYIDYPGTSISEQSLLELSQLDIKDGRYEEAISRLKSVKSKDFEKRKSVIIIVAMYKMGRYAEGVELLKKNIDYLGKEPEVKSILKSTIEYFVSIDDPNSILFYGRYLSGLYPEEQDYSNFSVATIYYRSKNYNKAYAYFSKIQLDKGEFRTESLYRLAVINELYYHNARGAIQLFQQLSDSGESDEFVTAGRIELALLYYEKGQKDLSRNILAEIISRKENVAAIIKAANIDSYYFLDAAQGSPVKDKLSGGVK